MLERLPQRYPIHNRGPGQGVSGVVVSPQAVMVSARKEDLEKPLPRTNLPSLPLTSQILGRIWVDLSLGSRIIEFRNVSNT